MKSFLPAFICFALFACSEKKTVDTNTTPTLVKKEKADTLKNDVPQKGPIINIVDTLDVKRIVLFIKDSAATSTGLSEKLTTIFNKKLVENIKAGKVNIVGAPMVWYKTQKAPFFFEAGVPVDKIPSKLSKGIFAKNTGGDSVLIAHFFGPNDLTSVGYDALNEMLADRKKTKSKPSYEIYINNPFDSATNKTDLYKLQTDIVVPYK